MNTLLPSLHASAYPEEHSARLSAEAPSPFVSVAGIHIASARVSDRLSMLPSVRAGNGVVLPGAEQELYGKAVVTPPAFALGAVVAERPRAVTLWNTQYAPAREAKLLEIENSDKVGLELADTRRLLRVHPGSIVPLDLTVRMTCDTVIDESIAIKFSEFEKPLVLLVTGSRKQVCALSPDWDAGVTETIAYMTSIIATYSGVEQRAMLRDTPVTQLTYTVTAMDDDEQVMLDTLIKTWQSKVVALPRWEEARVITEPAGQGAKWIACDTRYSPLREGSHAILWQDSRTLEQLLITDVQPTGVATAEPLSRDMQHALVVPLVFARLEETVQRAVDGAASSATLVFTLEPDEWTT